MLTTDPEKFWRVINPKDDDNITLIDSAENVIPSNLCASVIYYVFKHNFSATTISSLPPLHPHLSLIIIEPTGVDND